MDTIPQEGVEKEVQMASTRQVARKPTQPIRIIPKEKIGRICEASMEVLSKTGIKIKDRETLEKLAEAGAMVDKNKETAKIPPKLVEQALKTAPNKVTLWSRNPSFKVQLGGDHSYSTTTGGALYIFDSEHGQYRKVNTEDVKNLVRLADALDAVNINEAIADPQEIPHEVRDIYTARILLEHSEKHCKYIVGSVYGARAIIEMASIIAGGEEKLKQHPIVSGTASIISPLLYDSHGIGILKEYVSKGLPVYIGSEPTSGGTAPVTLAGTICQVSAEMLAGVVITQILNEGTPVIPLIFCNSLNMRMGNALMGTPEMALMVAAMAQLARYYNLPFATYTGVTDSKFLDMQAAYEKTLTTLLPLLAGVDIYGAIGNLSTASSTSYELLIIENEMIKMLLRVLEGFEITPETLAVEEIKKVGPAGCFLSLSLDHTVKYFKKEHWIPSLSDKDSFARWRDKKSKKDIVARAREEVKSILAHYHPKPLDPSTKKEMDEVVKFYSKQAQRRSKS